MGEKNDSGGGSIACKPGTSILHQDKGSTNKRKLDDPSLENPVIVPLSMSEFASYALPLEIFRGPVLGPLEVESSMGSLSEVFEPADWDDPIACQLEELLLSNLQMIFRNAIKKIVECGFKEDVAEKAISRHGLYQGGKDLVSNIVNDAIASLKKGIEGDISIHLFEDLQQLVVYTMLEMISVLREVKPCLSIAEAMWWLLMFDLNISVACEVEGDILRNLGCVEVSGESSSDSNPKLRVGTQNPETKLSISNESNGSKPSLSSEALKFGSFPNLPKPKSPPPYEGMTPEKEFLVSRSVSGDYVPVASISEEKTGIGRKGRSKKELAAMTWKEERMAKEKFLAQAASIRKERERLEAVAKVEEDKIKLKAEKDMKKYGEEIKMLENKLSELKMKLDSSKIAALRGCIDGGNGQCSSVNDRYHSPSFSKRVVDINDYSGSRGLKQERECVMCLSEEKIVVFLPCAHQVLCVKCNELHEKQRMKDCPACRTVISNRICARFAKPHAIAH
ncbi:hypothetical protein GOBAR_AA14488 [Gossypium barbadense]|uniref:RING-type domain-containing protein n=1 Tax=Gossypium barbadense TaxID=3634 RepID=A0A2P5XS81_GOSBA|nr:hypothetical protein GOBAR_AA14488 [Gossypium barbadense]